MSPGWRPGRIGSGTSTSMIWQNMSRGTLNCTGAECWRARWKQRVSVSTMRPECASVSWWQVISSNAGSWRVSWKPPRPWVLAPVSGVITTMGVWFQ